jgi:hypothetical protein
MIGRLWRYIFTQTLIGLLGAALIITAVIMLIDFVETSRDIGTRVGISAFQALHLSLLKVPLLVQDTPALHRALRRAVHLLPAQPPLRADRDARFRVFRLAHSGAGRHPGRAHRRRQHAGAQSAGRRLERPVLSPHAKPCLKAKASPAARISPARSGCARRRRPATP